MHGIMAFWHNGISCHPGFIFVKLIGKKIMARLTNTQKYTDPRTRFHIEQVIVETGRITIKDTLERYEYRVKCDSPQELGDMCNWNDVQWEYWINAQTN